MLDFARSALRSALGVEQAVQADVERHSPIAGPHRIDEKLHEAVEALHRTADSMERHVAILETLATSLPPLTESVTQLTAQIGQLLELGAPLQAAERDISRLGGLFRRRHPDSPDSLESPDSPSAEAS
ncbi:MAG: hypothetical protein ACR2HD_09155 [Solirubrobacteraceae bacterium]|nr:MAG: hypothetical protein DLM63_11795 [Solirubrobacterales bacterium]